MTLSPIATARALHAALEAGKHGEQLRSFFTPDAITLELPNALRPLGATTELAAMLSNSSVGAKILAKQSYDVHSAIENGSSAILRLTWTGQMACDVGSFQKNQILRAHIAQFIETRDGRVARIETYDCYEPFDANQVHRP